MTMHVRIVTVCLLLAATASAGIVEHHLYTPTSLPSAQGWTYNTNGDDEDDIFSIEGDVLVMDTIGSSLGGDLRFSQYLMPVSSENVNSAVLQIRARVTDYEFQAPQDTRGFTFGGHAPGWGPWYQYGLQPDAVYMNSSRLQDLDTTQWHEYTVIAEGFYPESRSTLLVDGELVVVMTGDTGSVISSAFAFGDMGWNDNARVEISRVELTTFNGEPVAVELTTLSAIKALFAD
jgi:hypothetical protein